MAVLRPFLLSLWCFIATYSVTALAADAEVSSTSLSLKATVPDNLIMARKGLLSALEDRNYSPVNELNVQQGLKNRGIEVPPVLLIEFINLSKAYQITQSNREFELFAPLRAALFEEKTGGTTIFIMRPDFIKASLSDGGLSPSARATLDEFERDMLAVLKTMAAGGF